MTKGLVIVLGIVSLLGLSVLAGPAQDILSDLADRARAERVVSGLITVGAGTAVGVGGYLLLADQGFGTYAVAAGGLMALPGVITLLSRSEAEKICSRHCHSEVESAQALHDLALRARLTRYVSGAVNAVAGTISLLFQHRFITPHDYLYSAIVSYGRAAAYLLIRSREERAYKKYLDLVETDR